MRRLLGPCAAMLLAGPAYPAERVSLPFALSGDDAARIEWGHRFASPNDDWVNDLVPLKNGNVMAVGFLNRADAAFGGDWWALAAELRPGGMPVAERRYAEQGGTDAFWSMAEAQGGNRVFAGFTTRIGPAGINGFVLVGRPDGSIVKENGYGHAGYDRFTDLAAAGDGFIFVGHSQLADAEARRRAYIVKTDAGGLHQWERIYGGPETWSALYIEPMQDGGFVIAGGTDGGGDGDMFVMKIDAEGREQWRKRVGTADWDEINHGLLVRPDGRIVLVGYTHRRGEDANDLVAATLSPTGELERLERFGGTADDRAILAKQDGQGRVWIVGHTASSGAGGVDLVLARLDREGRFERAALTIGGASDDHGTAVLPLGDGSLLVAGYSTGLGAGGQDAFVLKLRSPQWDRRHAAFSRVQVRP